MNLFSKFDNIFKLLFVKSTIKLIKKKDKPVAKNNIATRKKVSNKRREFPIFRERGRGSFRERREK